jgi:dTMP kinase
LDSAAEALLFAADRIEHVQNEVVPALNKGLLVISDRYVYSSLAYQGSTGLNLEWIEAINKHALKPDLAIFIDVAPETVMQRLNRKKSVMETLETQRKVREVYLKFVANDDLVRIDGDKPVVELSEALHSRVLRFLETF